MKHKYTCKCKAITVLETDTKAKTPKTIKCSFCEATVKKGDGNEEEKE